MAQAPGQGTQRDSPFQVLVARAPDVSVQGHSSGGLESGHQAWQQGGPSPLQRLPDRLSIVPQLTVDPAAHGEA